MVEEVNTGGLVKFGYSGEQGKLDEERKSEIAKGYEEYGIRKRKQRIRNIVIVGIVLVVLFIFGIWFFK
jgi:t-SNARE complex subunit (syntaxin)